MRSRALLVITALPIALSIAPSLIHGQTYVYRDCRDRYNSYGDRYYSCSYDGSIAARAREAAARARESAARARSEARESANWARSYARSYASAARADTRNFERSIARIRVARDAQIRAAETRFRQSEARMRADDLRYRMRERAAELRDRRDRYYRRW